MKILRILNPINALFFKNNHYNRVIHYHIFSFYYPEVTSEYVDKTHLQYSQFSLESCNSPFKTKYTLSTNVFTLEWKVEAGKDWTYTTGLKTMDQIKEVIEDDIKRAFTLVGGQFK